MTSVGVGVIDLLPEVLTSLTVVRAGRPGLKQLPSGLQAFRRALFGHDDLGQSLPLIPLPGRQYWQTKRH
jgi:hypothetical protein